MDKKNRNSMPDFDSLNDRLIAEHTTQPMLVIKTNLDPKDSTVDNPYYTNKELADKGKFRDYFEGENPTS
jgi:hypothetical protein